jgi:hypothetical protein
MLSRKWPTKSAAWRRSTIAIEPAETEVPRRRLLIVDGVFLHRRELRTAWTLSLSARQR